MRIAIIGAGLVGLATAAGLARHGAQVEVFERAGWEPPAGAGISLFPNSRKAMHRLGVGDGFDRLLHGPPPGTRTAMRRRDGRIRFSALAPRDHGVRMFHRNDLREFLLETCSDVTFHWGVTASLADDGDRLRRARLTVDGGGGAPCGPRTLGGWDLVIAADGLRSRTRTVLGLDPGLRYAGYTAWRGVTEVPVDTGGTAGEDWAGEHRFGTVPLADGRVYWFAVASRPAGETAASRGFVSEKEAVRREFSGWYGTVGKLIDATPDDAVLRHDIHDLARPLKVFHRGRVALVGDAAHAMTPDLGQGAGAGFEDAAALSDLVSGTGGDGPDVVALLKRYSAQRARSAARVLLASRFMGKVAHRRRRTP